jgi:hypothetical protein
MNDKIKELKQQALRWSGENVNRNLYTNYEIEQKEYEKFAELIVRECAQIAVFKDSGTVATADVAGYMAAGRSIAARLIKEHFGVEE